MHTTTSEGFHCGMCSKREPTLRLELPYCPWCTAPQDTQQGAPYRGVNLFLHVSSGKKFFPLRCAPEDFEIEDIAHALSNICRYGGHGAFYSVAEHAVLVSLMVPFEHALWGLLHDAAEAYVGDMVRPLKSNIPIFGRIEDRVFGQLAKRFGLKGEQPEEVTWADNLILRPEVMRVFNGAFDPVTEGWVLSSGVPSPEDEVKVRLLSPCEAKMLFLARFEELTANPKRPHYAPPTARPSKDE